MSDRSQWAAWGIFDLFFRPWMRHRIHAIRIAGAGELLAAEGPILICPNHSSWWDGFLVRELQRKVWPKASFHTVMLDEELGLRPFLRFMGAIGLRRGSIGSLRASLRHLNALRERDSAIVVVFFPQGKIWPSFRRPLGFQPGVRLFLEALAPLRVLPLGIHLETGPFPAPVAYLSAGELLELDEIDGIEVLERRVEEEVDAIQHFLALHGEHEEKAWPDMRSPLPRGAAVDTGPEANIKSLSRRES